MQRKVYILENLDCANCAAKIERKLSKLPELNDVSVTFATKQLRFEAEDPEAVLPKIRETIQSMEPDVEVVERLPTSCSACAIIIPCSIFTSAPSARNPLIC